jgi:hypothetical protein
MHRLVRHYRHFRWLRGNYLLENSFELLMIAVLGIAGILRRLGGAERALLSSSTSERARGTQIKKNAPQITSEWDYRPRKAIRPYAAIESPRPETSDGLSPDPFAINKNNNVWLNNDSLECTAHTFINLDPTVEVATTQAPLSGHAQAVSAYYQGPIDEQAAVAE